MENMGRSFQQCESYAEAQENKIVYAWGRAILSRALGTHIRHVCDESDVLGWDQTELKWGRAKALLLKVFPTTED